jgi:hypothetical protein
MFKKKLKHIFRRLKKKFSYCLMFVTPKLFKVLLGVI